MKTYRYYCLYRPPMPGTIPRGTINIKDFGKREAIPGINRQAWGYAEYDRKLTTREIYDYELAEAEPYDD